ncbi:FecR family protein [Thalassospira marina]|uniref:Iron dicitrate transport regulator FecR n=1 Tax=Thalassospira marina TaxID=2048283 RepID=A0ABM6QEH2_9PROT|nr:DUF4880 domain-containing protein [Thalassospira marina]AUG54741.1 iron dicitrate transport regulator FecR [Thalassospira marina]
MEHSSAFLKNAPADDVSEQAIYWFALLLDGAETDQDRKAFARWIAADDANRQAFLEIEHLWAGTSSLDMSARTSPIGRRAFLGAGLAAGLVGAAGWYGNVIPHHPFADFSVPKGERRKFTLMPGIQAELASQTSLSLARNDLGQTGLTLHEGEVFLEHDGTQTGFFVAAAGGMVRPREAARFDISHYDARAEVISAQGMLDVSADASSVGLGQGRGLSFGPADMGVPYQVDLAMRLAWRQGRLVFVGERLDRVATVLQRWQPGKIVVLGEALKQRPVTLVVNLNRTGDILPLMGKVLNVEVNQIGNYLTILRAA